MVWTPAAVGALAPTTYPRRRRRLPRVIAATVTAFALLSGVASTAFADESIAYIVQAGDTVFGLAQQFGVSTDDISGQNNLLNPNVLAVGQQLTISIPASTSPFGRQTPDRSDIYADAPNNATGPANPAAAVVPLAPVAAVVPAPPVVAAAPAPVVTAAPSPPAGPRIIAAPYHSQFDGSAWAETNCGPTAVSMALGALGVTVDQLTLRHDANAQMGISNPDDGTTWASLAYAAKTHGVSNEGLYNGKSYRSWSINDLKAELAKGHPVLLLVRYRDLPDHLTSAFWGDHYIVALGFDASGNLVYNDPAFKTSPGSDRRIDPAHLQTAWTKTAAGLARTAIALYR